MKSITVKDLDVKKDEKVDQFLNTDSIFKEASKKHDLNTDKGCKDLFSELYREWNPESFENFREKIASTFNTKLDKPFDKWTKHLALDRHELQNLVNSNST